MDWFHWNKRDQCWQSWCKPCRKERSRVWMQNPPSELSPARQRRLDDLVQGGARVCSLCNTTKPLGDFQKSPFCVAGRTRQCLDCVRTRQDKHRDDYKVTKWAQLLVTSSRSVAKKNNYAFDITAGDLEALWEAQSGRCAWFNVPLLPTAVQRHPQKPSLDRLDPEKGYVRGNVVLACNAANMGRNITGTTEFTAFLELVRVGLNSKG